jgi:hypothetical protein
VWSARLEKYEVEEWSFNGALRRRLVRQPSWFPPWKSAVPAPEDEEVPSVRIRGIQQTSDGRLWVLATVPRRNWSPDPAMTKRDKRRERKILAAASLGKYVDTMIDVIDPLKGQLLASQRVEGAFIGFASENLIYSRRELDSGSEVIDVWQVRLVER